MSRKRIVGTKKCKHGKPINKRTGVADKCERCANTYRTPDVVEGY